MEREYTIGALLVLVTIFVITLIIFFTVPEFSNSVKQIADEVFGTLQKEKEMQEKTYQRDEAIKVFESVKNCINPLKEKKDACTCYLESRNLPEGYYISVTNDKQFITLGTGEGRMMVEKTQPFSIKDINFCILKKGLASYDSIPLFVISSKSGKPRINDKEFIENTPEFYNLKEGNKQYMCFVTEEMGKDDVIRLRSELKDCKTGEIELEKKIKERFKNFIQIYKNCKEPKGTKKCKCGKVDFDEIPEPYGVLVSQQGSGTIFFLKNTDIKETVVYNKIAKIIHWFLGINNIIGYDLAGFEEKERIEGVQEIVYHGYNQEIYLAKPEHVSEMPLCTGKVNPYLKFDNTISKEEYKQKIVKFSEKAEPYFEIIYSAAKTYDIDIFLIAAIIEQESVWNPKILSPSGAVGLMQLMPYTAEDMGLNKGGPKYKCKKVSGYTICDCNSKAPRLCDFKNDERFDPNKNVNAGVKYVREAITVLNKDPKLDPTFENILTYYNAGPANTRKYGGYKGVPPHSETIGYVKSICGFYEKLNTRVCYV